VKPLRIGSRGSALALWQANDVRDRLRALHRLEAEIVLIKTSGDKFAQASVSRLGMKGVFIKELEDALLEDRIDLAVHSMKDVPTEIPPGLAFPAVTKREDVRDCVVGRNGASLASLPSRARVGTGSLRRQAQLRHYRSDLNLLDLRGNVDTRLRKLDEGQFDAIILAKAGLDRLGAADRVTEVISPDLMLPAVGQGALGMEARADARELLQLLATLDDRETRTCVDAERALLSELEGGCQVPLGAWGRIEGDELILDACVLSVDGTEYLRRQITGSPEAPENVGRKLGQILLDAGADRILRLAGRTIGDR
jgi:hydroxymethylbilane synthase